MSLKIDSDLNRFKDIVRKKVQHNLGKFITSDHIVGSQGGRPIKIPISNIDLPRFMYNPNNGGAGSGEGEIGDPVGGGKGKKPGKGEAGNEEGDHGFAAEFTPDELAQMLGEELQLPDIDPKGKGKIGAAKNKYNTIQRQGTEGLRHFKRTYKEALKRSISSGTYNPHDPVVIPVKEDKRYKGSTPIHTPDINAVIIYILDCSGSMGDIQKLMAKSVAFWIDLWLKRQYSEIETRFLVFDTEASEVDREQFFTISESGGTSISAALKYCDKIMKEDYPFTDFNIYPILMSDGDNYSIEDSNQCIDLLKNNILPNCNVFSYGQTTSSNGSGEFLTLLQNKFPDNDKVQLAKMDSIDDALSCIKSFLGKGK